MADAVIVLLMFLFLLDHYPDSFHLPQSNGMVVLEQYVYERHINWLQKGWIACLMTSVAMDLAQYFADLQSTPISLYR